MDHRYRDPNFPSEEFYSGQRGSRDRYDEREDYWRDESRHPQARESHSRPAGYRDPHQRSEHTARTDRYNDYGRHNAREPARPVDYDQEQYHRSYPPSSRPPYERESDHNNRGDFYDNREGYNREGSVSHRQRSEHFAPPLYDRRPISPPPKLKRPRSPSPDRNFQHSRSSHSGSNTHRSGFSAHNDVRKSNTSKPIERLNGTLPPVASAPSAVRSPSSTIQKNAAFKYASTPQPALGRSDVDHRRSNYHDPHEEGEEAGNNEFGQKVKASNDHYAPDYQAAERVIKAEFGHQVRSTKDNHRPDYQQAEKVNKADFGHQDKVASDYYRRPDYQEAAGVNRGEFGHQARPVQPPTAHPGNTYTNPPAPKPFSAAPKPTQGKNSNDYYGRVPQEERKAEFDDRAYSFDVGSGGAPSSSIAQGKAPKFNKVANPFADPKTDAIFGSGLETDPHRIEQRLKAVEKGKNTIGYDNYIAMVPKEKRGHPSIFPRTPNPYELQSKRAFDGRIKVWRRALHRWDDPEYRPDATYPIKKNKEPTGEEADKGGEAKRRKIESQTNIDGQESKVQAIRGPGDELEEERRGVELAEEWEEELGEIEETFSDEDVL